MLPTTNYKPRQRIEWTERQTEQFAALREAVAKCPKLYFLVDNAPVFLRTDASDYGIGAYLFQVVTDSLHNTTTEHPIAFLSKTLSGAQLRWSTIEKEAFAIYHAVTKWSHYLQDIHFTLQTDHANLTFINANSKGKVQRWKLEIQDYDFVIQHIPGVQNEVADFFSRGCEYPPEKDHRALLAAIITNSLIDGKDIDYADYVPTLFQSEEAGTRQISDLTAIMSRSTTVHSAASDIHSIRRDRYDLLVRCHGTGTAQNLELEQSSLEWVQDQHHWIRHPANNQTLHSNPKISIVGHGGVEATIRNMDKLAIDDSDIRNIINDWPGKRQDVRTFIRHCPCCQKMARIKIPIHTRPFTIASYGLWDCVAMDAIGPFPASRDNNKYLMVIIDTFSRYVELVPIKDTKATSAVAAILPFIGRYGIPSVFLTDNATQFVNETVRELMAQIDCNHITIHPHSHEENGIVERSNREVKKHIRDLIFDSKQPDIWDLKAPFAQRIINSQKHRATGVTPSELVFGHSLDLNRNILTRTAHRSRATLSETIAELIQMQEKMLHKALVAQTATDTHHIETAIRAGNTNHETEFPINSYVLVQYENRGGPKEHAPNTPLHPILRGPFRVVNKRHRDAQGTIYTCEHLATHKLEDFHVKLLQPFHYDERRVSPEDVAQTDYNLFTVESVRAHRWTPGKHKTKSNLMFLIKWEGYDDQSNTWEPWENVAKVGILHEYLRSIPALKRFANNNLTDNPDEVT
jgi:transposase InsO family protein